MARFLGALRALCRLGLVLAGLLGSTLRSRADTPPWVEPRALNIVDIAGQVPDSVLEGNIVAYSPAGGLAEFVSSERDGELLRIRVRLFPRSYAVSSGWTTTFTLLGHRPVYDHMGSSAPEMWLRLYDGDTELTSQVNRGVYLDPALSLPLGAASEWVRYPEHTVTSFAFEPDGLQVPANYGGEFGLDGDYSELAAVFTVRPANSPIVAYLGYQEATFQSYIGVGGVGLFQPLMDQLRSRYEDRHERIMLNIPEGANYVLFTYPPPPFCVYDQTLHNLHRPDVATVRLSPGQGMLSQDLTFGGAFPLDVAWQDADQVRDDPYLSLLYSIDRISPPECVVLAGTAYDPCFLDGNCSDETLEGVYGATATIRVIYLRVEPACSGLQALPLKMADDSWPGEQVARQGDAPALCATLPNGTPTPSATSAPSSTPTPSVTPAHSCWLYLPLILKGVPQPATPTPTVTPTITPTITGERPVGFFDPTSGRMVGYWPE